MIYIYDDDGDDDMCCCCFCLSFCMMPQSIVVGGGFRRIGGPILFGISSFYKKQFATLPFRTIYCSTYNTSEQLLFDVSRHRPQTTFSLQSPFLFTHAVRPYHQPHYHPLFRSIFHHRILSFSNNYYNNIINSNKNFLSTNMPPTLNVSTTIFTNGQPTIDQIINSSHVVIFTMEGCKFCSKAKKFFDDHNVKYKEVVLDYESKNSKVLHEALKKKINRTSVPQIFVGGKLIGGCDDMVVQNTKGTLMALIHGHNYEYDLIVIGGGSGGLAASKVSLCYLLYI